MITGPPGIAGPPGRAASLRGASPQCGARGQCGSPAVSMTEGLQLLVQLMTAATTTEPWPSWKCWPSCRMGTAVACFSLEMWKPLKPTYRKRRIHQSHLPERPTGLEQGFSTTGPCTRTHRKRAKDNKEHGFLSACLAKGATDLLKTNQSSCKR